MAGSVCGVLMTYPVDLAYRDSRGKCECIQSVAKCYKV